jgi:hypothetical protein
MPWRALPLFQKWRNYTSLNWEVTPARLILPQRCRRRHQSPREAQTQTCFHPAGSKWRASRTRRRWCLDQSCPHPRICMKWIEKTTIPRASSGKCQTRDPERTERRHYLTSSHHLHCHLFPLMAPGKIMCEQVPPMHHRLRGNRFQALRPAVTTRLSSINELRYLSFATLMMALLRLRMLILISNKFQFLQLGLTSVSARGRSDSCITVVIFFTVPI